MNLTRTRDAWHRVAEHVLAAAQYAETRRIGPHSGPPEGDPFWNAPFGATRDMEVLTHRGTRSASA